MRRTRRIERMRPPASRGRRAAMLILVLWILLILSVIAMSYANTVQTGLHITGARTAKVKARFYAKAAIERTLAELTAAQMPFYGHTSGFYDDAAHYFEQPIGEGVFSLLTDESNEMGEPVYGLIDESSRLNLNTLTQEQLVTFPEITGEMTNSLLDWRDDDFETGLDGAEDDYYSILPEPYLCKNRQFQTVGELLLVRGWDEVALFGEDVNGNRYLDRSEDDGDATPPLDNADGALDRGLARFFTLYARDKELDPNGQARLDLKSAGQEQLQRLEGMNETRARAIVQWRGNNQFDSLGDLLDVTEAQQQNQQSGQGAPGGQSGRGGQGGGRGGQSGRSGRSGQTGRTGQTGQGSQGGQSSQSSSSGQKVFNFEQAAQLLDWVCVGTEEKRNRVNLNTAPYEVLMALPGMTESLAGEILTRRQGQGAFERKGDLRGVNGMTEEIFRQLIDYVTVQSYQFRVVAEGRDGAVRTTIETVLDLSGETPQILYWREQ